MAAPKDSQFGPKVTEARTFIDDRGDLGLLRMKNEGLTAGSPRGVMKRAAKEGQAAEKFINSDSVASVNARSIEHRVLTGPEQGVWRDTTTKGGRRALAGDLGLPNVKKNGRSKGVRKNPYAN